MYARQQNQLRQTFHLQTQTAGQAEEARVTRVKLRISRTSGSSAALEPRHTPTPVIGGAASCSSRHAHVHAHSPRGAAHGHHNHLWGTSFMVASGGRVAMEEGLCRHQEVDLVGVGGDDLTRRRSPLRPLHPSPVLLSVRVFFTTYE